MLLITAGLHTVHGLRTLADKPRRLAGFPKSVFHWLGLGESPTGLSTLISETIRLRETPIGLAWVQGHFPSCIKLRERTQVKTKLQTL